MLTTSAAVRGAAGVHPHVQRGVDGVAEAAVGPVELQRGDAEVEQHALHLGDAEPVEDVGQLVEDGGDEGDAVGVAGGLDPPGGLGARVGVAVEADQPEAGVGVEHRERVAGQAEGGVDEDGAVGGAGGGEEFGDAFEEDGHVHRGPRAGAATVLLIVDCLSTVRGALRDGAARRRPAVGRGAADGSVPVGRAGGAAWGGVGRVGRSGARVRRAGAGGPPPAGLRLASGKSVRWCPAGAVGCRSPRSSRSLRSEFGTEPRGRRLGPGPVEPRGRRLVRRLRGTGGRRAAACPGITTASASPRSPCRRRRPPARPRRPPSWRRPRSRSGCPRRRRRRRGPGPRTRAGWPGW